MSANREPLHEASDSHNYSYRRRLTTRELFPVLLAGIAAGLAGVYIAKVLAERTTFESQDPSRGVGLRRRPRGAGEAG
jgi:H+/Cl- antiporter ClcA